MSDINGKIPSRDEEIQTLLDGNAVPEDEDRDVRVYRQLYRSLGTSSAALPLSFRYRVMQKILSQRVSNSDTNALVISTVVSVLAGLAGIACVGILSRLGYTSVTIDAGEIISAIAGTGTLYIVLPILMLMAFDGLIDRYRKTT